MATEQGFTPVFGPNGAVLNSPTMTPRMREEIRRAARPLTRRSALIVFAYAVMGGLFVALFPRLQEVLNSSPWWAGVFAGVVFAFGIGATWIQIIQRLKRWELIGPAASDKRLQLPTFARWSLALFECLAAASCYLYIILTGIDLNERLGFWRDYAWYAVLAGAVSALSSLALRWFAVRRGWMYRVDPS